MTPDADVIVVGAGPAGMAAATDLAAAGRRVIVLDMQRAPGGQIYRSLEANLAARPATGELLAALGPAYAAGAALIEAFRKTRGIDYRAETTVWELRADGTVGWLNGAAAGYLRAHHVVLANGAMERPTPFQGWTLPGVMTAGAVQTLLKSGRLRPEGRVVLAGTGPLILLLAEQLRRLGVRPALVARTDRLGDKRAALRHLRLGARGPLLKGLAWLARLRLAGMPMRSGISALQAHGDGRVERVSMTAAGRKHELRCDLLVVHDGIVPSIDLAHGAGIAMEWRQDDASWRPRTGGDGHAHLAPGPALTASDSRIFVAGDARQIGGADAAIAQGRHVASAILSAGGRADSAAVTRAMAARPFLDAAFPRGLTRSLPDDATIVCRCEEITAGTLRGAIAGGATDMNLVRGTTRCGMGPCQGRSCAATLARLLLEADPASAPLPFRARPPLRPLPLAALASLSGLDPELAQAMALEGRPETTGEGEPHG